MSAHRLRVGLVGCGTIAATHVDALAALADVELVACADVLPERAQALAAGRGFRAASVAGLLADPTVDLVSVCTPSGAHAEVAVPALLAGKHVIIEKPMEVTVAACDRILAAQRTSGAQVAVISQHRFDDAAQEVHALMTAGKLGRLTGVELRVPWYRTQEYYDSADWRGTWALDGGGALVNQGVHTLDLMQWIAGPVVGVSAMAATLAHERIEVEDVIVAAVRFAGGALGSMLVTTAAYPGLPARLALHGTDGTAVIEGDRLALVSLRGQAPRGGDAALSHALQIATGGTRAASAAADDEPQQGGAADPYAWGEAHRRQLADAVEAIRTGGRPLVDGHQGRAAVRLVTAVYESAARGATVAVDPETKED